MDILCGHAGVRSNGRADMLASGEPVAETTTTGKVDIVKTTYERMLADVTSTDKPAWPRMIKRGLKCDSSRKGCLGGRVRRVYSQR